MTASATETDLQLVHKYAIGHDAGAFSALVGRYQGLVYSTCLRILGDWARAEDAAQECFLSLAREADSIRTSPAGWLHRRARHAALDILQKDRASARRERVYAERKPKTANGQDPTWDEVGPLIDQAIDELPEEFRIVLVEHFLRRRTQAELAEELRLSPATLSRRVNAGVEAMRAKLKKGGILILPAALLALMAQHASAAVPETLTASLGKIAIAGLGKPATAASTTAAAASGGLNAKIAAGIVAALITAAGVTTYIATRDSPQSIPPTKGGATSSVQAWNRSEPFPPMKGQEIMMVEAVEITRAFMLVLCAVLAPDTQEQVRIDFVTAKNGREERVAYIAQRTENGFDILLARPTKPGSGPEKLYQARRQTVNVPVPAGGDPSQSEESVLSVTQLADGKTLPPPVNLKWQAEVREAFKTSNRHVLIVPGKRIHIERDDETIRLRSDGETYVVHIPMTY